MEVDNRFSWGHEYYIFAGCQQLDLPQDGDAWRRGYLHSEESSVELHPLSLRDTVSAALPNIIGIIFFPSLSVTFSSLHMQLWWLWLRQRECVVGALTESVCENHGLPPWADHGTDLQRLLETLQTLWKGKVKAPIWPDTWSHNSFDISVCLHYHLNKEWIIGIWTVRRTAEFLL